MNATANLDKKYQIIIPFGMRKEIAQTLNVCEATVWRALKGYAPSEKSKACRRLAEQKLKELQGK